MTVKTQAAARGSGAAAASAPRSAARAERPRISVFRSNRGISAQLIDDDAGRTLAAVNWTEAPLRELKGSGAGQARPASCSPSAPRRPASRPRCLIAAATSTTGACKALADGAREGGLSF